MKAQEIIVLTVLGAFIIITGRSLSNSSSETLERVDVNTDRTLTDGGRIVYLGDPYSVISRDGENYQIGTVTSGNFSPLKTGRSVATSSDFYVYQDRKVAVEKAKELNDPQSGGLLSPSTNPYEEATPADTSSTVDNLTENAYNLGGSPLMGW